MCGRFAITPERADAWASVEYYLVKRTEETIAALKPQFNIAPSLQIPIVIQDRKTGEIRAELARWGFVPHWHKQGTSPPMNSMPLVLAPAAWRRWLAPLARSQFADSWEARIAACVTPRSLK